MIFKEVNQRFLTKENIVPHKINVIRSLCGTGKTTAISSYLKDLPVQTSLIAPVFRRTLCSFLKETFENTASYLDCHEKIIDPKNFPRVCISPESFWRYRDSDYSCPNPAVLIWDEFCSFIEHLINNETLNGEQRSHFISMMSIFLKSPNTTTIICDAYFEDDDLQIVEMLAGGNDRIVYTVNNFRETKGKIISYHMVGPYYWKKAYFRLSLDLDKKIFVFSNCKSLVQGLEKEYRDIKEPDPLGRDDFRKIISGDSNDNDKMVYSTQPNLSWSQERILSITPTIQAGVSFTEHHFDKSFGYAIHNSGTVLGFLQQLSRARHIKDGEIHVFLPKDMDICTLGVKIDEMDINKIWANLDKFESWTNMKIYQLIERKLVQEIAPDGSERVFIRPDSRSVINSILVRYIYNLVRQRISFVTEFKRYLRNDWYQFEELDVFNCDSFTDDNPQIIYLRNIMHTFDLAKEFRMSLWDSLLLGWDGSWPGDEWISDNKGGTFCRWLEFADEWGIFGVNGKISEFNQPWFNKDNIIVFASKFCDAQVQQRFDSIMLTNNHEFADSDSLENRFNSLQFNALLYSAISHIISAYGIFPSMKVTYNIPGELNFHDGIAVHLVAEPLPVEFQADESLLNNQVKFESLCRELDRAWEALIHFFQIKLPAQTKPLWLVKRKISPKAMTNLRKLLDCSLKFIGLVRIKSPLTTNREQVFCIRDFPEINHGLQKRDFFERRIRVRVYQIENVKERVMLLLCKLLKNNARGKLHPNHFVPDPFSLLRYDKVTKDYAHLPDPLQIAAERVSHLDYWPLKDEYLTEEFFLNIKNWDVSKQTNEMNVLDRFDFWNPMRRKNCLANDLPDYYVRPGYLAKMYIAKKPLRLLNDNPFRNNI